MKKLTIYLGDLTHDTVGLATEVFPLNAGFVGAYLIKRFGDAVEVKLFKYIPKLEDAILNHPPDILALSNYPWCHNIDMAMFRMLKERKPSALRIMGGPNFPHEISLQEDFLQKRSLLDGHIYLDGEVAFGNFVEYVLNTTSLEEARTKLSTSTIPGLCHLDATGKLVHAPAPIRLKDCDEIPSPYQTGLLDEFFDGRLHPMIQTNRGCPFTCSFCADGSREVSRVNHFSLERVKGDLLYIAKKVPQNTKTLFISDLNYGMYPRDAGITDEIAKIKNEYNYPLYIVTTTGKNSKEKVISNIEKLAGTLELSMSVQSLTQEVLKNIKRENMRLDDILGLKQSIRKVGLPTVAEVILGLPGETKESHIDSINKLLSLEMDHVLAYTLMMLNGSELNTPENRARFGYKIKFRVIPRDFTRLKNGENVVEVEEVAVETNTLPFNDYVEARKFVLVMATTNNMGFRSFLPYLLRSGVELKDLLQRMLNAAVEATTSKVYGPHAPEKFCHYVKEFDRETREELWDSEEDLVAFFQNQENFNGLIEGRFGANLLQTYKAMIWAHAFPELTDSAFFHAKEILKQKGAHTNELEELAQIELYCRGRTYNIMGADRLETIPQTELKYDIESWMRDDENRPLNAYTLTVPQKSYFVLTEEQYTYLEDAYDQFGRNDLGKGKVLIRVSPNSLWRAKQLKPLDGKEISKSFIPKFYEIPTAVLHRKGH